MNRTRQAATVLATLVLVAAGTQGGLAADPPVTLRFAVSDPENAPSDPYVRAFVAAAAERSSGSLTIEPIWGSGHETQRGIERDVAHLVADGEVDLGLAASRAWDDVGATALQALQAPFLITDDALAEAIATDPIADDLLASLSSVGVTGLALWPEDLRHLVAFEPCIPPITAPDQLSGLTVRAIPSALTIEIIEALGAIHTNDPEYGAMVDRCDIQAAESGLRQGSSLPGKPTFTGDVTFFPKFQVLVANQGAFGRLTAAQQDALRQAALTARDLALAEHTRDAEAAAAWCADGGRVVLAGPDSVAAFQAATAPVMDRLAQDPALAAVVDAIVALEATIAPADALAACDPARAMPSPSAELAETIVPPDGTYRTVVTLDDTHRFGAHNSNAGTLTLTFAGSDWSLTWAADSPGGPGTCSGTLALVEGALRMDSVSGECDLTWVDVVWAFAGDELVAVVRDGEVPSGVRNDRAVYMSHPWTRID